jgi:hypothetical protein
LNLFDSSIFLSVGAHMKLLNQKGNKIPFNQIFWKCLYKII